MTPGKELMRKLHYPDSTQYTFDGVRLYCENLGLVYEAKSIDEDNVIQMVKNRFKGRFKRRSPYHYKINNRLLYVTESNCHIDVWEGTRFVTRLV